jgi:vacuolar-type H+-ATPase subunit D/Vma8
LIFNKKYDIIKEKRKIIIMDNQDKLTKDIKTLKAAMQKELQDMYMKGYAAGAVSACGILYKTFQFAGLEESNMLFTILKDLAEKNGCKDLKAYVEDMKGDKKNA